MGTSEGDTAVWMIEGEEDRLITASNLLKRRVWQDGVSGSNGDMLSCHIQSQCAEEWIL